MSKILKLGKLQKVLDGGDFKKESDELLSKIYFDQNMPSPYSDYIDSRIKTKVRKWKNNRLKKQGISAFDVSIITDINGNRF